MLKLVYPHKFKLSEELLLSDDNIRDSVNGGAGIIRFLRVLNYTGTLTVVYGKNGNEKLQSYRVEDGKIKI